MHAQKFFKLLYVCYQTTNKIAKKCIICFFYYYVDSFSHAIDKVCEEKNYEKFDGWCGKVSFGNRE